MTIAYRIREFLYWGSDSFKSLPRILSKRVAGIHIILSASSIRNIRKPKPINFSLLCNNIHLIPQSPAAMYERSCALRGYAIMSFLMKQQLSIPEIRLQLSNQVDCPTFLFLFSLASSRTLEFLFLNQNVF